MITIRTGQHSIDYSWRCLVIEMGVHTRRDSGLHYELILILSTEGLMTGLNFPIKIKSIDVVLGFNITEICRIVT